MKQAPFRLLRGKLDFTPCRFSLSTRFMDPRYVMGSNLFYIYIYKMFGQCKFVLNKFLKNTTWDIPYYNSILILNFYIYF
jgi:hypothetical protein